MKYLYTLSVVLVCLLLPVTTWGQGQNRYQHQKDSLRNLINNSEGDEILKHYIEVTNLYFSDAATNEQYMDTIMALYKECTAEAKRQKNLPYQALVKENMIKLYYNKEMYEEVIELASEQMAFTDKHKLWQNYYQAYYALISVYENKNNFDKALKEAQAMYKHAEINNNTTGKAISLYYTGRLYGVMKRPEDMEKMLKECIKVIGKDNNSTIRSIIPNAYYYLCYALMDLEKYEEGLQIAKNFETIIHEYENTTGTITLARNLLNELYRNLYFEIKDYDNAEIYCYKIDSLGFQRTIVDNYNIFAEIYYERRQYDKALEMCNKNIETSNGSSNQYTIRAIMQKVKILCAMQNETEIYELIQKSQILSDSLNSNQINIQLDDLRTQYEVDKHIVEKQRNRNYFFFAIGGCALLLIILGIWIYLNRQITRKNKGLVRQIRQQDLLSDELEEIKHKYKILKQSELLRMGIENGETEADNSQSGQLFIRLNNYLMCDRNFTKEINRDKLIIELGTNKTYLYSAVKNVSGKSLQEYINILRLEEARKMLESCEESIETIASSCGFNSLRTFYRLFSNYYDISPAAYRKTINEK